MALVVLIVCSLTTSWEIKSGNVVVESYIVNNLILESSLSYNKYGEEIVYEDWTLNSLTDKLNNNLSSALKNYGGFIATTALEKEVDPVVATAIILVETGCYSNCSGLVKSCNNVGGMKGKGCGSFAKFNTLEEGIVSFINNLSKNYYKKGLNTPELINRKYASNTNWYKNVYYYMNLIKAS